MTLRVNQKMTKQTVVSPLSEIILQVEGLTVTVESLLGLD